MCAGLCVCLALRVLAACVQFCLFLAGCGIFSCQWRFLACPAHCHPTFRGEVARQCEKRCALRHMLCLVSAVTRTLVMLHSLCCFPIRGEEKQSDLGALLLSFQVHFLLFYLSAIVPRKSVPARLLRGWAAGSGWSGSAGPRLSSSCV